MTAWGNGPTLFNPGGFDPVLFAKKWLISGAQNVTKVAGAHTMKAGAYYEWVNNSQPATATRTAGSSCGTGPPAITGNYFSDLLTGTLGRVRRAVAQHRARHGLQHLRGLRAGQLEGEATG